MMGVPGLASPGLQTLVALGTLLLLPYAALCQDAVRRVSLAEALEAFAENSLALRIARSEAAEIAGAARQSRAYFNPSFSISRDDLDHDRERHWEEILLISQPLEWPGRTAARHRAARHMIGAGAARFRGDSIQLAFEVREAYARAWFAEAAELTARQAASVIQDVTEDAEIRLDAGDISAFETRRLRLERVQAEQDVAEAELQVRSARRYLATLIFPGTGIEEIGPSAGLEGVPPPVTREEALDALPERPDLEAATRDLDAAQAEFAAANSGWVPVPTIGFGYRHQDDGFHGVSLGLDLPLPLFDRGGGAREEADARSSAAAYRLDLRSRLAENDLLATSERYASSRARLETAADGLLADGEALLESATAAYGENEMSLLELLDAASAFRNAQLSALSMRSAAWIDYYDLLRAMGRAPEEEG
ncbi:TolC family protein [Candidatus Palauibacter sp.]|uniref:TolC family protein n=1 Tax=Candidatus Palauibacter sp. TaxID=3101350 RepID=UPI003B014955